MAGVDRDQLRSPQGSPEVRSRSLEDALVVGGLDDQFLVEGGQRLLGVGQQGVIPIGRGQPEEVRQLGHRLVGERRTVGVVGVA